MSETPVGDGPDPPAEMMSSVESWLVRRLILRQLGARDLKGLRISPKRPLGIGGSGGLESW